MRSPPTVVIFLTLLCGSVSAFAADPVTLRFASLVPEGTGWARELKAFSREVEQLTGGQLRVKWYLGGIAGDESVIPERMRRGQIDGEAASVSCADLAPSLRVLRVIGLIRTREEAHAIIEKLRPTIEAELRHAGYQALALTWLGSDIVLSRRPIASFDDLRKTRTWIWSLDPVWGVEMKMMGTNAVALPVEEAGRAYESGHVDAMLVLPNAALAFQWSAHTRYFSNLTVAAMAACTVISSQAFDALPFDSQQALRTAAVKAQLRFEDINAALEDTLLGGLFEKQGTRPVPVSEVFRADFFAAARAARERLPETVVPRALISKVQLWLSDLRAMPASRRR